MEVVKELTAFYKEIDEDNRIGTSHISLYMALFQAYNLNNFGNPFYINRRGIMRASKICGLATYHKCIKDLAELGYIKYEPSYNPAIRTRIHLLKLV